MKNYSLVRNFGSSFGLVTLSGSIINSVGTEKAFATSESFFKCLFFSRVCDSISKEDLKGYYENADAFWEEQKKESQKNLSRLEPMKLSKLFKIWKFSDINAKEEFQKDETIRELALNLKYDVVKVIKGLKSPDFDKRLTEYFRSEDFKVKVGMIFKEDIAADERTVIEIFSAKDARELYYTGGVKDKSKVRKYENIAKLIVKKYFAKVPIDHYTDLVKKCLGANFGVDNLTILSFVTK